MPDSAPRPASSDEQLDEQSRRFQRIRNQISSARARQYGLGRVFVLTAVVAAVMTVLRGNKYFVGGVLAPLTVFLGFCISAAGVMMLLASGRERLMKRRRLSKVYFRWGLICMLLGFPTGIGLGIFMIYVSQL